MRCETPVKCLLLGALLLCACPLAHADIHAMIGPDGQLHVAEQALQGGRPFRPLVSAAAPPQSLLRPTTFASMPRAIALEPLVLQASAATGVDRALLHAVIQTESAYNSRAVSKAGAAGLMQLMPATAARFGVRDRFDPTQNLRGGARYLAWLTDHFDGDIRLAVAAYNAGEGAVRQHGNRIPPYAETRAYVQKVMALYGL